MKLLDKWLRMNLLTLNVKKTHYMTFCNKNKSQIELNIEINQEIITQTMHI